MDRPLATYQLQLLRVTIRIRQRRQLKTTATQKSGALHAAGLYVNKLSPGLLSHSLVHPTLAAFWGAISYRVAASKRARVERSLLNPHDETLFDQAFRG